MPASLGGHGPSRLAVVAGMPRTGSTSLFHILAGHPGVEAAFRKEVGYFLFNHHRGPNWFERLFSPGDDRVRLDVTPEYFFSPEAVKRMRSHSGDVKVILAVRDPVDFARSLHHEYGKRYRMPPIEEFLEGYRYRRGSATIDFSLASGTIRRQIMNFVDTFGDDLLLYRYEELVANPLRVLQGIERHLNLDPFFTEETFRNIHVNQSKRRNIRWLTALASAEPIINIAGRIVPASLLRRSARMFYGAESSRAASSDSVPAAELPAGLSQCFERDREVIDRVFLNGSIVNGAGRPVA